MMTKKPTVILITVAAAAVAGILYLAWPAVFGASGSQSTNDAYVLADYTVVAPKVSGFITQVLVEDNQWVKAGQEVAHIDDRDYQAALLAAQAQTLISQAQFQNAKATLERQASIIAQAQASVQADQAALAFAEHEWVRYNHLAGQGAGTVQNAQQSRSQVDQGRARLANSTAALAAARKQVEILTAQVDGAEGGLKHAKAAEDIARLNLSYTRVVAPIDGIVGQRAVRVGAFVEPGARMLAVVPLQQAYVVANFQETQLTHVVPGQQVDISVDTFGDQHLTGHVDSLAPATGVTFAQVKPDNATGNFTKVVQRIPVKIVLDADQALSSRLRVGMSVEARIRISAHDDQARAKEVTAR